MIGSTSPQPTRIVPHPYWGSIKKPLKVETSKDLRAERDLKTSQNWSFLNLWFTCSVLSSFEPTGRDCHSDSKEIQHLRLPPTPVFPQLPADAWNLITERQLLCWRSYPVIWWCRKNPREHIPWRPDTAVCNWKSWPTDNYSQLVLLEQWYVKMCSTGLCTH